MEYIHKDAEITDCGQHRIMLYRNWDSKKPTCIFIGLNPSTADADEDDPTIRRCVRFADSWGCGSLLMLNLFSYRATNPKDMLLSENPNHWSNDNAIIGYTSSHLVSHVVAAWGATKTNGRDKEVLKMLKGENIEVLHLGLTKNGSPKHPLYLKADTKPEKFFSNS